MVFNAPVNLVLGHSSLLLISLNVSISVMKGLLSAIYRVSALVLKAVGHCYMLRRCQSILHLFLLFILLANNEGHRCSDVFTYHLAESIIGARHCIALVVLGWLARRLCLPK